MAVPSMKVSPEKIAENAKHILDGLGDDTFAGIYRTAEVRVIVLRALLTEYLALRNQADALKDIAAERQRQIDVEGWTHEHDAEHKAFELSRAAATYALWGTGVPLNGQRHVGSFRTEPYSIWPWSGEWWKPRDRRRNLVKAGALILAEIERLDRARSALGDHHG